MKIKFLTATLIALVSTASMASAKEISVQVKGMVCGFCAQGIEKKFKALPEVQGVNVSLETKLVKVSTKDGKDVSNEKINEILREAGYNVEKIER